MSLPLETPYAALAPTQQSFRLTAKELRLRYYFLASFNDAEKPDWALQLAVRDTVMKVGGFASPKMRQFEALPKTHGAVPNR